jgi:hypothetical protein
MAPSGEIVLRCPEYPAGELGAALTDCSATGGDGF